ncbi:MAG: hypothetical protein E3J35_06845, partial [Methanomassiliicoccales archaeon]
MKPGKIKLRNVLNGKIVSILTAIFVVGTVFAASVSNDQSAEESVVLDEDIAEELDVDVGLEVEEELVVEEEVEPEVEEEVEPEVEE